MRATLEARKLKQHSPPTPDLRKLARHCFVLSFSTLFASAVVRVQNFRAAFLCKQAPPGKPGPRIPERIPDGCTSWVMESYKETCQESDPKIASRLESMIERTAKREYEGARWHKIQRETVQRALNSCIRIPKLCMSPHQQSLVPPRWAFP